MYSSPMTPRSRGTPTSSRRDVPEEPILEFKHILKNTRAEQWQKRTNALKMLVSCIPDEMPADVFWYNSPTTLRHLANPINELLKDPRSSVVKSACESLQDLFYKCGDEARYLFKDIMATILSVHAQTVQIIRTYVQNMVVESLPYVHCKMVMPLWIERLKVDKSRTVREACSLYLGSSLMAWSERELYLSEDNWCQVGASLLKCLRDASPQVRKTSKTGLDFFRKSKPDLWEQLINDPNGPVARDRRLQKLFQKGGGDLVLASSSLEDMSVGSRSYASRSGMGAPSPSHHRGGNRSSTTRGVPSSIAVNDGGGERKALGPPRRILATPFAQAVESPRSPGQQQLTPESTEDIFFDGFISNLDQLKGKAKGRRSRRSSVLEERWKAAEAEEEVKAAKDTAEHVAIANQLLDAHKRHVDQIMETLRIEMATLGDFEQLLLGPQSSRPNEEDVLEFFECIGICLDQRTTAGNVLQREMDRISKGC